MGKSKGKGKMTQRDASRIQSSAGKSGKNQDFKARAQWSESKNTKN